MDWHPKVIQAADRLRLAAEENSPCKPVRDLLGPDDVESAYQVQFRNNLWRLDQGEEMVGCKIGLTSKVVQEQIGVDQPDFGWLFGSSMIDSGSTVSWNDLMQPKVEAEVALVLNHDLEGPDISMNDLKEAVAYAVPSIEIVGSRIENWDIRIADTIADNASGSHYVLSHHKTNIDALDLSECKMRMYCNGALVSTGSGLDCLGSPLNAALWLARKMGKLGSPLKKGNIILTGALGPMGQVNPGDFVEAEISPLGAVSVEFSKN